MEARTMRKLELIKIIEKKGGLTRGQATLAFNATIDTIVTALKQGDKVTISGFGIFSVRNRNARSGINPQTGEKINIEATKAPAFKASKLFKQIINS
jgi:DNA-binding protein HU-beta